MLAIALVVLASISFLFAGVGTWMQRSTLEKDVWEQRVGTLGEDEAVQKALSAWVTQQLLATIDTQRLVDEHVADRSGRLTTAIANRAADRLDEYLASVVDEVFASDRFASVWATAANSAHEQVVKTLRDERGAVTSDDEKIQIDLIPLLHEILAKIDVEVPALLGSGADEALAATEADVDPDDARARLAAALHVDIPAGWGTVTVYDGGKLSLAQTAVKWIDRLPLLTAALTAALVAAALWVSPRRRRTALQLVAGFAVACVALRFVCFALQDRVLAIIASDVDRDAARAVMATLIDPLTAAALTTLLVLAAVAAVLVLTGPYPWAESLRRRDRSATEPAS